LSALEKAIAADPFTDLGTHLKRYQEYRATIQQDYDSAKNSTSPETTKPTGASASATAAAITMPTPPSSFGGSSFSFGGSSSSGSPATSGGLAPKTDTASKPSGFTFSGSSSASQPFAKAPETKSDSSAKPSLTPSASSSSLFGGKPAGTDHDDDLAAPSGATSLFGSPANLTPTSGTPFNFSSSAFTPSSTSNPFAASKPAGGSGFSFGGSAFKAPDPSNPFGLSSSGGAPSASSSTPAAKPDTAEKEENGADDAAGLGLAPADHDKEGAGEEDEDTTHAIKSRIYKWGKKKTEDGTEKDAWADMGYGQYLESTPILRIHLFAGVVRLKCHKEDGSRRMLSRNSSTGKIVIVSYRDLAGVRNFLTISAQNFNLYPNLDVTVKGRNVLFIGRDESGIPVRMNIKPQTDAQATELQEAIQRDVQQLKKKT
jgi:nucleoporin NUP2